MNSLRAARIGVLISTLVACSESRVPEIPDRVRLASVDFEKVIANLTPTTDDAGIGGETLLGGEVLRRFKVIVDYTRSQVTLEPNRSFREPFEFDMSGMSLAAQGADLREYRVRSVVVGTPAERAGIAAGDIVVSIDDRPARDMTLADSSRSQIVSSCWN